MKILVLFYLPHVNLEPQFEYIDDGIKKRNFHTKLHRIYMSYLVSKTKIITSLEDVQIEPLISRDDYELAPLKLEIGLACRH